MPFDPANTGADIWRDYVTEGVPASGNRQPPKSEIRTYTNALEASLLGALSSETLTPSTITANQNNYNPTGFAAASVVRLAADAPRTITGMVPPDAAAPCYKMLLNVGSHAILLPTQSASSTAANRFRFIGNVYLAPDQTLIIWYDALTSRWVKAATGGGPNQSNYPTEVDVVADYDAVDDCLFYSGGAIDSGTTTLTIDEEILDGAAEGKPIVVPGAGAAGADLITTIASVSDDDECELTDLAGATVASAMGHFGTDNGPMINNAIGDLVKGGICNIPCGDFAAGNINMTGIRYSLWLRGRGMGINAPKGTVLAAIQNASPQIDAVGCGGCQISDMQLGTTRTAFKAYNGILFAQRADDPAGASILNLRRIMTNGYFNKTAISYISVGDSKIEECLLWNYGNLSVVLLLANENKYAVASPNQTILAAEANGGNITIANSECHDHLTSVGATTQAALLLRGFHNVKVRDSLLSSSSSVGVIVCERTTALLGCADLMLDGTTLYTENGTPSASGITMPDGTLDGLGIINSPFTATAQITGTRSYLTIPQEP